MTTRTFSLPLSRWHHVADRIRQIADSKSKEALTILGGTQLSNPVDQDQATALSARGQKALANIELAAKATEVVGLIRQELAQANAERGVNTLLAQAESKRRQAQIYRSVAGVDLVTKVPLEQVNKALEERGGKEREFYGRSSGVAVALVKASALDSYAMKAEELESEVASLNDTVADLNRHTISIALPEDLAKAAGLK